MANEYLKGAKEASDKLIAIDRALAKKALKSAVTSATTPVKNQIAARAPRGKKAHRLYNGLYVQPGYLSRSIKKKNRYIARFGAAQSMIGIKADAFYGLLLDQGPHRVTRRRISVKRQAKSYLKLGKRRRSESIKPYTIPKIEFFRRIFVKNANNMTAHVTKKLKSSLNKVL